MICTKKYQNNRVIIWGNRTITFKRCGKWFNRINCVSLFVSKLIAMSHKEKEACLKRRTVPRIMNIYDICTTIFNGYVSPDCIFMDKIRCHELAIRILGSRTVRRRLKNILFATWKRIKMINRMQIKKGYQPI